MSPDSACPWRRFESNEIRYRRVRAVFLPDLAGFALFWFFYGGALLVTYVNFDEYRPFSLDGNLVGVLVMTGIGSIALLLPYLGWRSSWAGFVLTPEALVVRDGAGEKRWPWKEMAGWHSKEVMAGRVAGVGLALAGNVGGAAAATHSNERGIVLFDQDGRSMYIMMNELVGGTAILRALEEHGVPMQTR